MEKRIGRPRVPLRDRAFPHLVVTPAPMTHDRLGRPLIGPCLIWQLGTHKGYGTIWDPDAGNGGSNVRIHRALYEMFVGPIEYQIDHLCRVKNCASPAHLEDVTGAENTARADRYRPSLVITHCKRGHELNPTNARTVIQADGSTSRICRLCDNEGNRRRYAEWRTANPVVPYAPVTHCRYGHPYDEANTYRNSRNQRFCRTCGRRATREYLARKKARDVAA